MQKGCWTIAGMRELHIGKETSVHMAHGGWCQTEEVQPMWRVEVSVGIWVSVHDHSRSKVS